MPEVSETEPLLDPDCRDGKCGSRVGGPCEHSCHVLEAERAQRDEVRARLEEAERRILPETMLQPVTIGDVDDDLGDLMPAESAETVRRELALLRARAQHAEGELSSRVEQHMRAVNRATAAEGEAERLRAELAEAERRIGHFKAARELSERDYKYLADQLFASCICDCNPETTGGPEEDCPVHGVDEYRPLSLRKRASEAEAERDALKAAIEKRREQHDVIEDGPDKGECDWCQEPWPCPTRKVLDALAALDAPETPDRDPVYEIPDEDVIAAPHSPADAPTAGHLFGGGQ